MLQRLISTGKSLLSITPLLVVVLLATSEVNGQKAVKSLDPLQVPEGYGFQEFGIELSSITKMDGHLYALSEKCKLLYKMSIEGSVTIDEVIFLGNEAEWKDPVAIEAVAVYGDWLIMTDEGVERDPRKSSKIYAYNTKSNPPRLMELVVDSEIFKGWNGNYGAEGIAVNSKQKKLYVLREKVEDASSSELITFDLVTDGASVSLEKPRQNTIRFSTGSGRFSDLMYSADENSLYLLEVNHNKNEISSSEYRITTLPLGGDGYVGAEKAEELVDFSDKLLIQTLKDGVDSPSDDEEDYAISTNIEGLYRVRENEFMLVSDNATASKCGDTHLGETGVFRLRLADKKN